MSLEGKVLRAHLTRLCGLFERNSQSTGARFLIGRLAGARVLVLPNPDHTKVPNDPPFLLSLEAFSDGPVVDPYRQEPK